MASNSYQSFSMSDGTTFHRRYTLSKCLGEGYCGQVYSGKRIEDGLDVAIKRIENFSGRMDPVNPHVPLEVSLMYRLSHINSVVKLIDACIADRTLFIIMEYIPNSMDLFDFTDKDLLTPELMQSFFRQLVETVIQCHDAGVVHNDIKPENILVDLNTNTIKLIDFGHSSQLTYFTKSYRGTTAYKPPECYRNVAINCEAATVWSLGICLDSLISDRYIFPSPRTLTECDTEQITFEKSVPAPCQDLIRSLLRYRWNERPYLEDILDHPYLNPKPTIGVVSHTPQAVYLFNSSQRVPIVDCQWFVRSCSVSIFCESFAILYCTKLNIHVKLHIFCHVMPVCECVVLVSVLLLE